MGKEPKAKEVFSERVICPHCKKRLIIKKTKKVIEPAVKAEYEEKIVVEKDSQTTLPTLTDKKRGKKNATA